MDRNEEIMKKYALFFILLSSSFGFAQKASFTSGFYSSNESTLDVNLNYFKTKSASWNNYKLEIQYSIYNPKPGLCATKTASEHFYSFKNTAILLGNEIKNTEKKPIFPDSRQESLGDKIISTFITSILE